MILKLSDYKNILKMLDYVFKCFYREQIAMVSWHLDTKMIYTCRPNGHVTTTTLDPSVEEAVIPLSYRVSHIIKYCIYRVGMA